MGLLKPPDNKVYGQIHSLIATAMGVPSDDRRALEEQLRATIMRGGSFTQFPQYGGNSNYQSNSSNGTRSIRLGPFNCRLALTIAGKLGPANDPWGDRSDT
jgi:hypothetical protein